MNETGIIWTEKTWNPVSGCKKITSGCAFCYAETISENKRGGAAFPNGFGLTYRPHKLREPFALKEPSLIFVNSMSDFAWEEISDEYRDAMLDVMRRTPMHEYQVLTKRPELLARYASTRELPPNFWAGVTIEDQDNAGRLDVLRKIKAEVRFVSAEPLLGPLSMDWTGIDWCIIGGESGLHLSKKNICDVRGLVHVVDRKWTPRPEREPWVRDLIRECRRAKVKVFFKQWGGLTPKAGGRTIDGKTWDQFPRLPGDKKRINNPGLYP